MAFKLVKSELVQFHSLIESLRTKAEQFENSQNKNDQSLMMSSLANLIVVVNEAEEFRSAIAERLRNEFEDKSDSWQESDRGSEVSEFVEQWEECEFTEPDLECDLQNLNLDDYATTLEDLPTEL